MEPLDELLNDVALGSAAHIDDVLAVYRCDEVRISVDAGKVEPLADERTDDALGYRRCLREAGVRVTTADVVQSDLHIVDGLAITQRLADVRYGENSVAASAAHVTRVGQRNAIAVRYR